MANLDINKSSTALVVIDLQKGIVFGRTQGPYTGEAVLKNANLLADACRKEHIPVILVNVKPNPGLKPDADEVMHATPGPDWADLVITVKPEDILITKKQWGAFYGTDLELQLRRRDITTIILCGISTNIGVESTARFAYEYGFNQVFVEDAMTAGNSTGHATSIQQIFKRIGKVRTTQEVIDAINHG